MGVARRHPPDKAPSKHTERLLPTAHEMIGDERDDRSLGELNRSQEETVCPEMFPTQSIEGFQENVREQKEQTPFGSEQLLVVQDQISELHVADVRLRLQTLAPQNAEHLVHARSVSQVIAHTPSRLSAVAASRDRRKCTNCHPHRHDAAVTWRATSGDAPERPCRHEEPSPICHGHLCYDPRI